MPNYQIPGRGEGGRNSEHSETTDIKPSEHCTRHESTISNLLCCGGRHDARVSLYPGAACGTNGHASVIKLESGV